LLPNLFFSLSQLVQAQRGRKLQTQPTLETRRAAAAVVGISVYTILVGAHAAVVRSAIMGGLSIFARQVGRPQHGLNTQALTAAVMAFFNLMILGGLAVLLGLVYYPLGQLAGYLALPFVTYTIHLVELFAGIPVGELSLGEVSLQVVVLFFVLLFGWTFARSQLQARFTTWGAGLPLGVVGILAVLTWRSVLVIPDGKLHLALLDISYGSKSGDAILVTTPQGRHLLIDGGPYTSLLSDGLGRRLPLGERELDWLVVGGVGEDQLGALPKVIERFPLRMCCGPGRSAARAGRLTCRMHWLRQVSLS
jgi:hypothetical protein